MQQTEPKMSTTSNKKSSDSKTAAKKSWGKAKAKMDLTRALGILGFSSAHRFANYDAVTKELNDALAKQMDMLDNPKSVGGRRPRRPLAQNGGGSASAEKQRQELFLDLHEAYQFLSKRYINKRAGIPSDDEEDDENDDKKEASDRQGDGQKDFWKMWENLKDDKGKKDEAKAGEGKTEDAKAAGDEANDEKVNKSDAAAAENGDGGSEADDEEDEN